MLGDPVYEDLIIYEFDNLWNDESQKKRRSLSALKSHKFYTPSKEYQFYKKDSRAVKFEAQETN